MKNLFSKKIEHLNQLLMHEQKEDIIMSATNKARRRASQHNLPYTAMGDSFLSSLGLSCKDTPPLPLWLTIAVSLRRVPHARYARAAAARKPERVMPLRLALRSISSRTLRGMLIPSFTGVESRFGAIISGYATAPEGTMSSSRISASALCCTASSDEGRGISLRSLAYSSRLIARTSAAASIASRRSLPSVTASGTSGNQTEYPPASLGQKAAK